jgi:hypothetical protein
MTYTQLINAVSAALAPLVTADGGTLEQAETLEEAQKFLSAAPHRWRLILHWEGLGSHPDARLGMTSHQVATVIQQPRGLLHRPGENLTKPLPGGALPFSERLAQVTSWMAALKFPDRTGADDAGFSLESSQWLTTAPNTAAHTINWKLDAALPPYTAFIPLTFPHLIP